jgi:hypothetical protein
MKPFLLVRALLVLSLSASVSFAQSSGSPAGSNSAGAAGQGGDQSGPAGVGFSIESEMLTYKSLEANSEAIACDIARHLLKSDLGPPTPTAPCTVKSATGSSVGVVIVSSSNTVLPDFQSWRADMFTMNEIELEAKEFACPTQTANASGKDGRSLASTAADLTPYGQMIPMAESVLGLFAKNESISPVTGTIHDQALMNGVARQLEGLGIPVLIPEIYSPHALEADSPDSQESPFLRNLARVVNIRICLQTKKDSTQKEQQSNNAAQKVEPPNNATQKAPSPNSDTTQKTQPPNDAAQNRQQPSDEIGALIATIDSFIGTVTGNFSASGDTAQSANGHTSGNIATPIPASTGSGTHIMSILNADGLARMCCLTPDGTAPGLTPYHYVLWLKALESGGSVAKEGNIFGTKIRFSGGAVSTYALFSFEGTFDCSGNVFDYEGSVLTKDFANVFRQQIKNPNTNSQLAFMRGGCTQQK